MKNTIANLSLVFMLSMALASSYAENLSEQVADNSRLVNPYEGSFSYSVSSLCAIRELIDNQQATQYDERYKFTGKERD